MDVLCDYKPLRGLRELAGAEQHVALILLVCECGIMSTNITSWEDSRGGFNI